MTRKTSLLSKLVLLREQLPTNYDASENNIARVMPVVLDNNNIKFVKKVNNLGFIINDKFSWSDQINKSCSSIFSGLRSLWHVASILPTDTKLKLVQALLGHHITAGDVITGKLNSENTRSLQRAFNAMTRFVFNLRKYDHISHLSDKIFGLDMVDLLQFRRQVFLFNLIRNKEPDYLYEKLQFFSSHRLSNNIRMPQHQHASSALSFFVHEPHFWNSLPREVKSSSNLKNFKTKLLSILKN